jgi:uncharacterized phage protein (TIGR02218 family)
VSKSIPSGLADHYAEASQSTALLVKITRRDGEVFGVTSHDQNIPYDGVDYLTGLPSVGMDYVAQSSNFASDNTELKGLLTSDGLSHEDIEAGTWDGAKVEMFRVNWNDLADGHEIIGTGELGQFAHDGVTFQVEYKGLADKLQKPITRNALPVCDATFGDARCGINIASFTFSGSVTSVVDRANFTDSALAQAADYFTQGVVNWLTGDNAGRSMEVKAHATGGVVELALYMASDIQVGDSFDIVAGDDHLLATCRDKFSNIVNFRGFAYVPGLDQLLTPGGQ